MNAECAERGAMQRFTFSAVYLTTLVNSWTTRSIHLRLGSFSLEICFFTMASKAMSGVNKPTLIPGHKVDPSLSVSSFYLRILYSSPQPFVMLL